jgi:uncharacterized protein
MYDIAFRVYGRLNDFLPLQYRQQCFVQSWNCRNTVKDAIESLGIPHTEIALIIVNHKSEHFSYILQPSDFVSVYPEFSTFDISPIAKFQTHIDGIPKFVLDVHLGRLARFLRFAGYDCLYRNDYDDKELAKISDEQHRILLSRDIELLKRKILYRGYYVRNTDPLKQFEEVLSRYGDPDAVEPLTRCPLCNGFLTEVKKAEIESILRESTKRVYDAFSRCDGCGQIYWEGTHYVKLKKFMEQIQKAVYQKNNSLDADQNV